jgi:ABC-2 type transport system permease protein
MRKALSIGRKEVRQILRDRRSLLILLFVPAFFLLVYGYALSWDIRHIRLAVDDRDRSAASRALIAAFVNSGYFDLVGAVESRGDLTRLMDRNEARLALVIPTAFAAELRAGRAAPVQIILNGDNANTAATVMSYAQMVVRNEAERQLAAEGGPGPPRLTVESRVWYNPQLRSTLFLVPGLIAYIVMITAVVSTAVSIVKEKERGTMEQVRMAPVDTLSFVLGKTIPYFVVALVSAMVIVFVAVLLFGLPMRGSWTLLAFTVSLFIIGTLGLGLLISSVADSQQVAFQLAALASFLPSLILSGFIFPIASMPAVLRGVTYLVPARYFLEALRGIVLKGTGLAIVWDQLLALAVFAVVVLLLASVRLRRQWT